MIQEKRGRIAKDYQILELLGKGGFGEVKKVVHRLTRDVRAMKIIKKDKCDDTYQDSRNIYLITEYLEGGELFDLILKTKHFNENIAAKIMK